MSGWRGGGEEGCDLNREEKIVLEHLKHLGFQDIVYEPDGNIPPDFLADGEIAIEVRRLNQHYKTKDNVEPLEKLEFNLIPRTIKILEHFSTVDFNVSHFVIVRFERPISNKNSILRNLKDKLTDFLESSEGESKTLTISENLEIDVFPSSKNF